MNRIRTLWKTSPLCVVVVGAFWLNASQEALALPLGISVSPQNITAAGGTSFSVELVQHSDLATSGAQVDLTFDHTQLQVTQVVAPSGSYASAFVGSTLLADANATGALTAGAFLMPGNGAAPPGDTVFAVVTLKASGVVNTTSALQLSQAYILDSTYEELTPIALSGGTVTIERDHKTDANADGYSAADEITVANCGVASCANISTFGAVETNTCKDSGGQCGLPNPPLDESGSARVAPLPATGYGCSVTLDTVGPLTTVKLAKSDVDLDGAVSILDHSKVASWFGNAINTSSADPRWEGNMDADNAISILDISAIAANFGRSVANNCKVE